MDFGILKFKPAFMERIWGGTKLDHYLSGPCATTGPVGEAWLISDHPQHESVVCEGPHEGARFRSLLEQYPSQLLGRRVSPTPAGRFPLLLKLIDAGDVLSVQVHPDDMQAKQLGEPDTGKTEMWHVLDADPDSVLTSGLLAGVARHTMEEQLRSGDVAPLLRSFAVSAGDTVFVAAGAVHAIGGGVLLAEIQQNSDITYRLFDWNRLDSHGQPRALHIDKALAVIDFTAVHGGRVAPLRYTETPVVRETLAACRYFAAEKVSVRGTACFDTRGATFHIVLALDAPLTLQTDSLCCKLGRGEAALIAGAAGPWRVDGHGAFLDYFIPDLEQDIVAPLRRHGYADAQIALLGGTSQENDLRAVLA